MEGDILNHTVISAISPNGSNIRVRSDNTFRFEQGVHSSEASILKKKFVIIWIPK